jgi:RNA polymerase sigma-54 factor
MLDLRHEPRQTLSSDLSPALVAFTELLALPAAELELRIDREVAENPAIERVDSPACPWCGDPGSPQGCPICSRWPRRAGPDRMAPGTDGLERLPARPTRCQRLLDEARLVLEPADVPIAEWVVGNLDARGYLVPAPAVQHQRRVERVLDALRLVRPAGDRRA